MSGDQRYRHEFKYIVTDAQIPLLKSRIENFMALDSHATDNGIYNIRSLYFDDFFDSCFYENENGTDPREKFRIRIYNHSLKLIHLECKRKERGKTLKKGCAITKDQFDALMTCVPGGGYEPLLNKLSLLIRSSGYRPVIITEYERLPFVYKNGNVRVTFDMNICSSSAIKDFFKKVVPKRPIMPLGHHLLEVKFDEFLPDFIYHALNLSTLQQTAYSKYYLCRKFSLKER